MSDDGLELGDGLGFISSKDGFLMGWLDAIWSGFSAESHARMATPRDVERELVRRGWLRPRTPRDEIGDRRVTITPEGSRMVLAMNERAGIRRTVIDDREEPDLPR